ncbi:MAG: type II secretion system protein N [Burkholderiaceae bacterium]|jgi:general secretion pathway protein N|nr:type II secretion system protein N [Burkholderiaceae bacterium]
MPYRATASPPRLNAPQRPPWRWAGAGVIIGMISATMLLAPARWLGAAVARASQGRVLITQASGTIWRGAGQLVLTGGADSRDRAALPGQVRWRLRPELTGARLALASDCCTPREPLSIDYAPRWSGSQVRLADAQARLPADWLDGLGAPFNTLQLRGELGWQSQHLTLLWQSGRLIMSGQIVITARAMSSRLSPLHPLGSYQVTIDGGDVITLKLTTLEGRLQLTGDGQWTGGRLHFQGLATPAPGMEAQLANLLNAIGRRRGNQSVLSLG